MLVIRLRFGSFWLGLRVAQPAILCCMLLPVKRVLASAGRIDWRFGGELCRLIAPAIAETGERLRACDGSQRADKVRTAHPFLG